jgi:chromosomal replication initiator protein
MANEETYALWQQVIHRFRDNLTSESDINKMERYFPLFTSFDLKGDEFLIGVKEDFHVDWFTPLYATKLEEAFTLCGRPNIKVKFIVSIDKENTDIYVSRVAGVKTPSPQQQEEVTPKQVPNQQSFYKEIPSSLPLYENYTFKNFVEGPSNSFAHSAAMAVAKNPSKNTYNPLFIYGGTGLGKTHLMQAIGHYVRENNPQLSVCFTTAETFMNEYVEAMVNKALPDFRARYRKVDLLLLDDVQFLVGKKQFQEEFFNTFSALLLFQKQIVMTSDVAPRNLQGVEERLISRFSGGMVVEIELPSYETRLAILKSKALSCGHDISLDILTFIATNIKSHVRAMEGALRRLTISLDLNPGIPLTIEYVRALLKDLIDEELTLNSLTIENVMQTVAKFYNVTIDDLRAEKRTQTLVTPRQMAMYLSRRLTSNTLTEIAKQFGKKHATVHHGMQTIQKRIDVEPDLRKDIEEIVTILGRNPSDIFK